MDGEPELLSDTATNCNLASASETQSDYNHQAKLDSLEKKAVHLRLVLEKDFKAADFKWSLFVAAAFSFRYESCLRPFPPAFMKSGVKDMDELLSVITDVPALDLVLQQLDNLDNLGNISEIIDLLFYVLVRLKEPNLKTMPPETHDAILASTMLFTQILPKPQYIFQVNSSCKSSAEMKWKELSKNHNIFFAFHGNRLENFYTILNFGLQQNQNKNTILSSGVHLSTDLSVSLPHSHGGFGWGASCIGGHLSVVAMCEVIDAPDGINYQKPVTNEGDGVFTEDRTKLSPEPRSLAHYVVTNCDLMRVRYLLVYAKQPASMRFSTPSANRNAGGIRPWFSRHKLFSILLGYGLMLATIGFANNQPINYYYRILLRKLDIAYSAAKVQRADGKSLPVAVLFYNESWERGGGNLPCQELAAEGVVVVTVVYRLHLLSFFSLGSPGARGNLALLDQYMALLWVRDNIAAFGGNPISITLIGHSAGADSVLHHMASPRTTGLFQRVILMSPRDIWKALDEQMNVNLTDIVKLSRLSAHSLGCTGESDQEILHCMRTLPVEDIVSIYSKTNWSTGIHMQPTSDYFLPDTEQYLPMSLSSALSLGKQPMQLDLLLGYTNLEAAFNGDDYDYEDLLKRSAPHVTEYANTKVIPELLRMLSLHQSAALPLLALAVRWEYFGPSKSRDRETLESVEALARMQSAATWGASGALLAARLARRVSRVYVYRYSQPAGVDLKGRQFNFTGAVHGSDIVALLGDALMLQVARRPATPQEKRISSDFRKYIANFVKFGAPAADEVWPRYKADDPSRVQEICLNNNLENTHNHNRDVAFWLQYISQLAKVLTSPEHTEQLTSENVESRLRGGVFAMSGVTAVLLLLLLACAILLQRERAYRTATADNSRL